MKNIAIGIDLGTTNSEVAILDNGEAQVVKNTYGDEFTPSVFGISKAKDEEVGKKPYQRYFKDATEDEVKNNKPEVKRLMGTKEKVYFPRIEKSYNAEEISSKILTSLRQDAIRKNPNIPANAAVITIPAHFSTIQAEATKRAGILAGFGYVVLLQEPIAAAISYGFGRAKDENWLVYDLGGGTFDAALISCRDGNLKVLSHSGNNFLGGKDIDAKILEEVILPAIARKYSGISLTPNEHNKSAFAKMKFAAEQAKIELSRLEETNIEVDIELDSRAIYENIPISQNELESALKSLIDETIALCQKTINEAGIRAEAVNKIILVGGPTQLPFIKKRLESQLSIAVDTSSDPLTAVARGACIFAMGQTIPEDFLEARIFDKTAYEVKINYESLTSESDEMVVGVFPALVAARDDYFVQIQSQDNTFNSGKIRLKEGKFVCSVAVAQNRLNLYYLYLFDKNGQVLNTQLNEFSITHGLSVSGAPIPHSIGIGVSIMDFGSGDYKQVFEKFFEKNSIVPLSKTISYKTIKTIKSGESTNALPITIYEGESANPHNNLFVCEIALTGEMLGANLYEGSAVDITIKVNESREVSLEAYIPALDKSINARATVYDEDLSVANLEKSLEEEIEKLDEIQANCSHDERMRIHSRIAEIKQSLKNANNDEDTKRKTNAKIKELQSEVEDLAKSTKADNMKDAYNEALRGVEAALASVNSSENFKKRLEAIKSDAQKSINANDMNLLGRAKEQLERLRMEIFMSSKEFWAVVLDDLSNNPAIRFNSAAQNHINNGIKALNNGNIDEVRRCIQQAASFLPREAQASLQSKVAGITR